MRVRILGVGMGPQHVTPEVAEALAGVDYVIAARKSDDDPLLTIRRLICAEHGVALVEIEDPQRDRRAGADYSQAVTDWHVARVAAYEAVLAARGGTAAFLVWGDPSLYDSTVRVVDAIDRRGHVRLEYDVLPGISAPQLLAARHRIVLHEVGRPVHLTTGRRLREAIDAGQDNIVVLLSSGLDLDGIEDWSLWWGANLGAAGETLVAGRVGEVADALAAGRAGAREAAGWVMELCLLRREQVAS